MTQIATSIGETLRRARESKRLSLESVSAATKINIHTLQHIESGTLEKLPGELYIKSFLRQYANFLGVDSVSLLEQYRQASSQFKKSSPNLTPQSAESSLRISIQDWLVRLRKREIKRVLVALGVFLFMIGAWRLLGSFSAKIAQLKQTKSLPKAIVPQTPRILIPRNVPLEVTLRAIEPTWVQVKVDDVVVFQNVLGKDAFEVWRPKKQAELWVGNAGNIEILLNGKLLGKPGKKGRVMKGIVLSREGMTVPAP